MSIYAKLLSVQQKLKAPKNQFNSFGKYNYRSCEDILEGLKPHLEEVKAIVILNDEIVMIGDRYYIKAIVKFIDIETGESQTSEAFAREDQEKKGMDLAQVTGSVSSYARKYALNGLFCIDDTKDSDHLNTGDKDNKDTKEPWKMSKDQQDKITLLAQKKGVSLKDFGKKVTSKDSSQFWNEVDYTKVLAELLKQADKAV